MAARRPMDPTDLAEFREALQNVYGPFEMQCPTDDAASSWRPPALTEGHKGRYLWVDAFGVINFITLFKSTGSRRYLTLASCLISVVHEVLGRTRDGTALLPGASPSHPLSGGLRIGKEDELGSDGDGQYHHYLTLWMFALNRFSLAAAEPRYNTLAIELAQAIHPAFMTNRDSERPRMYWKVSIDLTHPLVGTEGNLDPFDGYIIYSLLNETGGGGKLEQEIAEYKKIVDAKWRSYHSDDPLDLGMTLWTAHWKYREEEWLSSIKDGAFESLVSLDGDGELSLDCGHRLAFREFGSVLGLKCYDDAKSDYWMRWIGKLMSTWKEAGQVPTPRSEMLELQKLGKLAPITLVMYCAAVCPGGEFSCLLGSWERLLMVRQLSGRGFCRVRE
ncbi:hypothetical protein K440DRAFT_654902 [Wilcoxina mikolae CBS 423.85]|nr:hypothetical protein K440DRAFT_654902 [Wilcoxina mikolae CBS 423.85]